MNGRNHENYPVNGLIKIHTYAPHQFRDADSPYGIYNIINWTNQGYVMDYTNGRRAFEGTIHECEQFFDANRNDIQMSVNQVRILGDGTKDSCVIGYN